MPTLGWRDIACADAAGTIQFRDFTIDIGEEHLARWQNDPDGRFRLRVAAGDPRRAELEKFYPSL